MQRPTAVTVFGILNIVFGTLGVLCTPFSLLVFFLPGQEANPVVCLVRESALYLAYMVVVTCTGFLAAAALIVAGIGLLQMKRWGRVISIVYGIISIVMGLTGTLVNVLVVFKLLAERTSGPEAAGMIGGMVGGLFGGCVGLVYPIALLVFMTRPHVRDAFTQQAETVQK